MGKGLPRIAGGPAYGLTLFFGTMRDREVVGQEEWIGYEGLPHYDLVVSDALRVGLKDLLRTCCKSSRNRIRR